MIKKYFLIFMFLVFSSLSHIYASEILIQSTTSTRDSGFYDFILPKYPRYNDSQIKVVAVGTGQAIKNAKNCDADLLIVHDSIKEINFMNNKFGIKRENLMYNDYVLIGPTSDPANVKSSPSIESSFKKIFNGSHMFVSRSDSSGTHSFEISVWEAANIDPKIHSGKWYLETGQGMGQSLNIAVSTQSYILTDRSSWENFMNKQGHSILYENSIELANTYGIILINPDHCPRMNYPESLSLYNWLVSEDAKKHISDFTINGTQVFYVD